MRSVKSGDQQMTDERRRPLTAGQSFSIGFGKQIESRGGEVGSKFPHHRSECRQIDFLKIRIRGAQLLEQMKEMIRRAANGNGGEAFGFGKRPNGELFLRGEREQQTQMLAWWRENFRSSGEEDPEMRRRDKLQAERGKTCLQKTRFERLRLTARPHNDYCWMFDLPGLRPDPRKPICESALPRRFWRRGNKQSRPAIWLKL